MKNLSNDQLANIIIGAIMIILLAVILIAYPLATRSTVTATVTDKARITNNDSSYYLIYTNEETLRDSDSLVFFKFDSSDIYGRIQKGQTCKFSVYGLRVPFFSIYRNIIGAECH